MNIAFSNKTVLGFNLVLILVYTLISVFSGIEYSIFCVFHMLLLFFMVKNTIPFASSIKRFIKYYTYVNLFHIALIFANIFVILFSNQEFLAFTLVVRFFADLVAIVVLYYFIFKSTFSKYTMYLYLEFSFVAFVVLMLSFGGSLPLQPIPSLLDPVGVIRFFVNIVDYMLFVAVGASVLFIAKYENRFVAGKKIFYVLGFIGFTFAFSNIYFVVDNLYLYHFFLGLSMVFISLFCFFLYEIFYEPIFELSEDGDIDYRIRMLRDNFTVKFVVVLTLLILFAYILNLIDDSLYIYVLLVVFVYTVLSLQLNKSILNYLMISKENNLSDTMNAIIKRRNDDLILANAKLHYASTHDKQTKLPNRDCFVAEIRNLIEIEKTAFSFSSITIENMGVIRNLYDSSVSDDLTQMFVERLKESVSNEEFIYRISLDEYAIISTLDGPKFFDNIYKSLERLSDLEYNVDGVRCYLRLKVAFSSYPEYIKSLKDLFLINDLMAFEYKKASELSKELANSEAIMNSLAQKNKYSALLKEADYDKDFMLYYQPQFDINTKELVGAEALIRWKYGDDFISPGIFIPIAEKTRLIYRISDWVGNQAIKQMEKWAKFVDENFRIGVNISPLLLTGDEFLKNFSKAVENSPTSFERYDFEITEYSKMDTTPALLNRLKQITDSGISLSIDDFGTGFSSLSYINMYGVQRLKIAKELIDEIVENEDSKLVVIAIISIANTMGMETIAEGVEEKRQLDILKDIGCGQLQGYIWGRPLPADRFEERFFNSL